MAEMSSAAADAAAGKRSGKFRHIFGDAPKKPESQYTELKNPLTSGEARYVSANDKFLAVSRASGGGPVMILGLDELGRIPMNKPLLSVQKGKVWDHDFHPFITNMIATASDDCSVAVTRFPMEGLQGDAGVTEADVMMSGHGKKVVLCTFNPTANSILASASFDRTVKVWNIETQEAVNTFEECKDNIYSLEWNMDGSRLAITGKNKKLHMFDPRTSSDEATSVESFEGTKSSKVFWMPNLDWIGCTGFSKTAQRQLKFWDLKNLSKPVFSTIVDNASSVLMPYYDNDHGVLYMFGKGDGSVQYSEVINDGRKWYPLGAYKSPEPQKGGGWISKRACNVWKCEVNRFLKLTKNSIIPVSFIVPRKSGADVFQEDIYPDTAAGKPALSADEWLQGQNGNPVTMSLDPEKRGDGDAGQPLAFSKKQSYQELEEENAQLKQRVKELEEKLGISGADAYGADEAKSAE